MLISYDKIDCLVVEMKRNIDIKSRSCSSIMVSSLNKVLCELIYMVVERFNLKNIFDFLDVCYNRRSSCGELQLV